MSDGGTRLFACPQVRAGAGGDEASLFAADLFRMYERYASRQPGWRFEARSQRATSACTKRSDDAAMVFVT